MQMFKLTAKHTHCIVLSAYPLKAFPEMKEHEMHITLLMDGRDGILDLVAEIKHGVKMSYADFFLLFKMSLLGNVKLPPLLFSRAGLPENKGKCSFKYGHFCLLGTCCI